MAYTQIYKIADLKLKHDWLQGNFKKFHHLGYLRLWLDNLDNGVLMHNADDRETS